MRTEELKFLLALEPTWTVSINGLEFLTLPSSEISVVDSHIQIGRYSRRILDSQWLRADVVRIHARTKFRSQPEVITFYPGERLPSYADLRRRRRAFQTEIGRALCGYFGTGRVQRQLLYSDRRHGIGGAYPRFLLNKHAVVTVDPDESSAVINGIMRAAMLWAPLIRRSVSVIVPLGRRHTLAARLRLMPETRKSFEWLQWDGNKIEPLDLDAEPETHVQQFCQPDAEAEIDRICAVAPGLLQAIPHISGKAVSIRLRGIEVARVSSADTTYPLGGPLDQIVRDLDEARRYGSRHPLSRAYEERWLESNLIGQIERVLPSVNGRYIYPQVPSFVGEQRNVIDLLTVTKNGRLIVIEIKASADPDLPFQALDYWIAVERHRKAGDFSRQGYFPGCPIRNEPAVLVLVAPLLAYHKTLGRLIGALPAEVPLIELGINQSWKKGIKILRRRGIVS